MRASQYEKDEIRAYVEDRVAEFQRRGLVQ